MYRVTTPTHTFTLPIETATCTEILVTYRQGKVIINKHYENGTLPDVRSECSGRGYPDRKKRVRFVRIRIWQHGEQRSVRRRDQHQSGDRYDPGRIHYRRIRRAEGERGR